MKNNSKCILLYSGGLDSLLAAKILMNEGVDVTGLHFVLPYIPPDTDPELMNESVIAKKIGLNLIHYRCGDDYIEILKNPPHGYGKNINPCIDCKIFFIRKAAELMNKTGADFVATGEVVGQRPMSQLKNTLNHIEKSTLNGRLLRPLSAKILKPTIPEQEGLIKRENLYDISGRGRSRQLELAKSFGITDYSSPAGGCLFTDSNIAERIRDLIKYSPHFIQQELYLLKTGRHFRINEFAKIVVSKNEKDSNDINKFFKTSDYFFIPEFKGPVVYVSGEITESEILIINSIICRYGRPSNDERKIEIFKKGDFFKSITASEPIGDSELEKYRI